MIYAYLIVSVKANMNRVWRFGIASFVATPPVSETKGFIDEAFNKLQQDLKASRELSINYTDFIATAHEELNYIRWLLLIKPLIPVGTLLSFL